MAEPSPESRRPLSVIRFQTVRADGHEYLAGQPVKEVINMTKGRRSVHEIEENQRFGLEALRKSVNIKPMLILQVP
jgi:hypothetical protein